MRCGKSLAFFILAIMLAPVLPIWAQQKPFTQAQVSSMVRAGLGDDSGAKLIGQRGIDFAPTEDFLQSLKAAGASEAFLNALRAAKPPEPAAANKPLRQVQILALLAGGVPSHRVAMLVEDRGINFDVQDDYLQEVRLGGGDDELIGALKAAKVTKPVTVDPAAEARQAEVRQHAARGAEHFQREQYPDAEAEYRAAVRLDPQNADLHVALARSLNGQRKSDEAIAEAREALRLNPGSDLGHYSLGNSFRDKGDVDGAIAEYHESLRLNPNNDLVHGNLGIALSSKDDWDGDIAEQREALRLNPKSSFAHINLGVAFAHKGDVDTAIGEYREALRLNPNNSIAHYNLGNELRTKGDVNGEIGEYREALRLNPNYTNAHNNLGVALEQKGDYQGALEEYRAATTLDPKDSTYKQNYERMLQRVNK